VFQGDVERGRSTLVSIHLFRGALRRRHCHHESSGTKFKRDRRTYRRVRLQRRLGCRFRCVRRRSTSHQADWWPVWANLVTDRQLGFSSECRQSAHDLVQFAHRKPRLSVQFEMEDAEWLQLRVFCVGLLEDGKVGVGIFPEGWPSVCETSKTNVALKPKIRLSVVSSNSLSRGFALPTSGARIMREDRRLFVRRWCDDAWTALA